MASDKTEGFVIVTGVACHTKAFGHQDREGSAE